MPTQENHGAPHLPTAHPFQQVRLSVDEAGLSVDDDMASTSSGSAGSTGSVGDRGSNGSGRINGVCPLPRGYGATGVACLPPRRGRRPQCSGRPTVPVP